MDLHRNDGRELAEASGYPRLAILVDTADDIADIGDLHAIALPRDRADDRRIRHEIVHVPLVQERMAEREDLVAIHGCHRARRADREITADDGDADRAPGREARVIVRAGIRGTADRRELRCTEPEALAEELHTRGIEPRREDLPFRHACRLRGPAL